jgi:hypothetical protein
MSRREFVRLPSFIASELNIMEDLHTQVFCGDGLSLAASSQQVSHGVGSSLATPVLNTYLST